MAEGDRFELSSPHLEAIARQRRVVQNFDILLVDPDQFASIEAIVESRFAFIDDPEGYEIELIENAK